jgi:hypothetical protein
MKRFRGLSRREFLKLISLAPTGIYARPISKLAAALKNGNQKNIIILVFDAWSQHHVSLYGYRRRTMPELEKFAENAIVYHNHYSTGTYTVPGTASLLTGMYPWSHRAFQLGGALHHSHVEHTIFSALSSTHSTLAFSQNKFADQILNQLDPNLDDHLPYWSFDRQISNFYGTPVFDGRRRITFASFEDNLIQKGKGFDSSLFFGLFYRLLIRYRRLQLRQRYGEDYPRGLPHSSGIFLLPDVVDGAISLLKEMQGPSLVYIHFYPPHEPYYPSIDFINKFDDGWTGYEKTVHEISEKKYTLLEIRTEHRYYDEFIANWDHEVARLFQYLKESNLTENSYIIVTSDHGELFERGEMGHWTKLIYDPVIHVPLLIHQPGQTTRRDVRAMTSSVDLLPTIAHLTGNPRPVWSEGILLPELGGAPDAKRSHFSMDAKYGSSFGPLVNYSMALTRDGHRLMYYCYPKDEYKKFEFYDIQTDVEEMRDLYPAKPALAAEMQDELLQKVEDVNQRFRRNSD